MQIHVAENVKYTFHEAITNDSNTYPGSIWTPITSSCTV